MIGNTLTLVIGGPVLAIGGSSILAYVVAKYNFHGKNLLISINVIVISLPIIGGTAATYRLFSRLGMINSPLLLINYIGNFGGNFLYMLNYCIGMVIIFAILVAAPLLVRGIAALIAG